MQEKIGNVVLDYEYYPGEDLYSDGPIEEELLELARLHLDDYSALISQKSSWPVVYHFSKIGRILLSGFRLNQIITYWKSEPDAGRLPALWPEKAEAVTCIELSKKRSYINAHRNHRYANIRIQVGNFQDIEPNLTESYDYIH